MIAARQIAFGKAAGAAKPYKARLEYIESSGTQYIDTGASPVGADIDFSFAVTGLGDNNLGNIFGAMAGDNATDGVFLRAFRSLTNIRGLYGDRDIYIGAYLLGFPTIPITEGQRCDLIIKRGESVTVNGTLYRDDLAGVELTTPNSVYLFAAHVDAGLFRYGVGRVYGYKATYADRVLSLIPVLDNDLVPCMYDEVSGEFFYNQGTGEFIAGPEITEE